MPLVDFKANSCHWPITQWLRERTIANFISFNFRDSRRRQAVSLVNLKVGFHHRAHSSTFGREIKARSTLLFMANESPVRRRGTTHKLPILCQFVFLIMRKFTLPPPPIPAPPPQHRPASYLTSLYVKTWHTCTMMKDLSPSFSLLPSLRPLRKFIII